MNLLQESPAADEPFGFRSDPDCHSMPEVLFRQNTQNHFFAALAACLVEADDSRTGGLSCARGPSVKGKNAGYHRSFTPFGGNLADSRGRAGLRMESP